MINPTILSRSGALHDAQRPLATRWTTHDAMPVAASFAEPGTETARLASVGIADLGHHRRAGVKGPKARAWLVEHGITTPARPNQWLRMECASIVARLGDSEFVVVAGERADAVAPLTTATATHGVYPVPHFDADLLVIGRDANSLLLQTCAFDFASLDVATQPLVMTSMVGVGVTVLAIAGAAGTRYRIWCDGTYGGYLWQTLTGIAAELGGGAVGADALAAADH